MAKRRRLKSRPDPIEGLPPDRRRIFLRDFRIADNLQIDTDFRTRKQGKTPSSVLTSVFGSQFRARLKNEIDSSSVVSLDRITRS